MKMYFSPNVSVSRTQGSPSCVFVRDSTVSADVSSMWLQCLLIEVFGGEKSANALWDIIFSGKSVAL